MGSNVARNIGVLYDISTNAAIIWAMSRIQNRENIGTVVSILSMSAEKRFTIRPRGVVSKKVMGA